MNTWEGVVRSHPLRALIAVVIAVLFAFPIWFMVTSAFKAEAEVEAIPMHLLPWDFQGLARFRAAAEIAPLWTYFLNSWIYALTHGITVFFGALAGFGFAKDIFLAAVCCSWPCCRPSWCRSRSWSCRCSSR